MDVDYEKVDWTHGVVLCTLKLDVLVDLVLKMWFSEKIFICNSRYI